MTRHDHILLLVLHLIYLFLHVRLLIATLRLLRHVLLLIQIGVRSWMTLLLLLVALTHKVLLLPI